MNSTHRYYELYIDVHVPGQWTLDSPVDVRGEWIVPKQFFQGVPVQLEDEPFVPLHLPGIALDYSEAIVGVLSQRLFALWQRLGIQDEVQLIPARVEGQAEQFFLLNTLRIIRCVDESRCAEVTFWEPDDGYPEKVGQYRSVMGLKIDPTAVGTAQVFRPWGWKVALIVSERVKQAMEAEGLTGARFVEV